MKHCLEMGLSSLPYFQLYLSGKLVSEFSCNLNTIARLRSSLSDHTPATASLRLNGDFSQ